MKAVDLSELKTDLTQGLKIFLSKDINSKVQDYRLNLRNELVQKLSSSLLDEEKQKLLDLNHLPETKSHSISLSHCPLASVISYVQKPFIVGIDLEEKSRLSEKLIARIATPTELKETPNPLALLSAKEAGWKCLNSYLSIGTFSQVETSKWLQISEKWTTFQLSHNGQVIKGQGFFIELSDLYLSFYISDSTFV